MFGCINFYLIFLQKPFVTLKIIKTTWFLNETPRKVIEVLTKTLQVYPYIAFFNVSSQVAEKSKSTNKNKKKLAETQKYSAYTIHFVFRSFAFTGMGYPSARKVDQTTLKLKETKRRRKKMGIVRKIIARKKH